LKHLVSPKFWALYRELPADVRRLADKNYEILKTNSRHPSLHFKKVGDVWSVRVGAHYRALAVEVEEGMYWVWIGTHAEYDKIVT
jgi:hypothetical protein